MRLKVNEAIECLNNGEVIGIVTDTVIGFAATKENIHKIYDIKQRELNKPLIQMVDFDYQFRDLNAEIKNFMDQNWPGKVTIIYPVDGIQTSYRIPNEKTLLELLKEMKVAIFTTSANVSGEEPCLTISEFEKTFPNINILDTVEEPDKINEPSKIFIYEKNDFRRIR
jgi:L-threonylcarbamoyladenylate synthase